VDCCITSEYTPQKNAWYKVQTGKWNHYKELMAISLSRGGTKMGGLESKKAKVKGEKMVDRGH
jgi:hypothetical protein